MGRSALKCWLCVWHWCHTKGLTHPSTITEMQRKQAHEWLITQFTDFLEAWRRIWTYFLVWRPKAMVFNLCTAWYNSVLVGWPSSPRERCILSAWAAQVTMSGEAVPSTVHWTETALNHFTSPELEPAPRNRLPHGRASHPWPISLKRLIMLLWNKLEF